MLTYFINNTVVAKCSTEHTNHVLIFPLKQIPQNQRKIKSDHCKKKYNIVNLCLYIYLSNTMYNKSYMSASNVIVLALAISMCAKHSNNASGSSNVFVVSKSNKNMFTFFFISTALLSVSCKCPHLLNQCRFVGQILCYKCVSKLWWYHRGWFHQTWAPFRGTEDAACFHKLIKQGKRISHVKSVEFPFNDLLPLNLKQHLPHVVFCWQCMHACMSIWINWNCVFYPRLYSCTVDVLRWT